MYLTIILPFDHNESDFNFALQKQGIAKDQTPYILKKSLDARNKKQLKYVYHVSIKKPSPSLSIKSYKHNDVKIMIAGAGPAGLFAAYWLILNGIPSILIDRGESVSSRMKKIASFIKTGVLDEDSNVCFGAGGAGTFSDGKLMTRIKSPFVSFIMETLVKFGADDSILYVNNPHLGSNKIRQVISKMISFLEKKGVLIKFDTKLMDLKVKTTNGQSLIEEAITSSGNYKINKLLLATGHSARDVYYLLNKYHVKMEFKPFAVGVRVEHPSCLIDKIQHGEMAGHPKLGHAEYKLAYTQKNDKRAVYTFCMCPGGYVINSSTERDGITCNGMSNFARSAQFSNSAIVVNVSDKDIKGDDVFKGLRFQKYLEKTFFKRIQTEPNRSSMPAIKLLDFINKKCTKELAETNCYHNLVAAPLYEYFPEFITDSLIKGLKIFSRKMPGFLSKQANIIGVETRTSAPVKVLRDKDSFESLSLKGLYPIGEGAGYAGGITSSAVDAIKVVQALLSEFKPLDD